MRRSSLFVLLALGLLPAQNAWPDDGAMWALLKKPGHMALLRHSNAPETPIETDSTNLKNCAIQRNLDEVGRAQARRIGDEFRKHGITRVHFVSSQYCRAMETAKLTKLGPVQELPALNLVFTSEFSAMRDTAEKTIKFMKTIPVNQLTVFVSHVGNIQSIAHVVLSSGDMAVVHIDAAGAVAVDGRITVP